MAKAKQQTLEKIPSELKIPKEEVEQKLKGRIEKGKELLKIQITNELQLDEAKKEYRKWNDYNFEYLRRIFSTVEEATKYKRYGGGVIHMNPNFAIFYDEKLKASEVECYQVNNVNFDFYK